MSQTPTTDPGRRSRPRLRLLPDDSGSRHDGSTPTSRGGIERARAQRTGRRAALAATAETEQATVLIVGAQPGARAKMQRQLHELLPAGTPFVQASETWEVVARASSSRLVVLTGDLCDLSARGLMRVLSRRHPLLPVIAVGGCTDGAAASQAGAASL
jgi:UDP-N-acetyl-D-mannosaminuronic acid transferase (WecB/TagA/CpsF family)